MKRVELLINEVRELTGNQRYDANTGVSQYLMVRSLKNAQNQLYKQIVNAKTKILTKEFETDCVDQQELYSYPDDLYLQNIETMQWSLLPNTSGIDYINLNQGYTKDRLTSQNGYPFSYVLRGDGFLLVPPVANGRLRITYTKRVPDLEKRSGRITSVTVVNDQITAMTLDAAEESFDPTYLNQLQSLSVVDNYGNSKALNIEFTSVNIATGVVTFPTPQTLRDGDSVANGDYVTGGNWTYNKSELPDVCEPYLIKHSTYEIRYGDASNWTKQAVDDMAMELQTVMDSFKNPQHDITEIIISNSDYLDLW